MYPSSYSNRYTSFSGTNNPNTSFCNCTLENFSNPSQDHYHPTSSPSHHLYRPHHISSQSEPQLFQQQQRRPFFTDNKHQDTVPAAHEHLTRNNTNLQSTMEKSSYNNGTDHFNSHVVHQKHCSKGKRASNKDRHSKINTAQGPRDRRMRLSLDVAKKFFKLQDMLGFDKASNTIEWLLMKSKPDIQDLLSQQLNRTCSLIGLSSSASSASECEVMSGIDDQSVEKTGEDKVIVIDNAKSTSCSSNKEKKRLDRGVRKSAYIDRPRETREQARQRARKRTTEKKNNNHGGGDSGVSGSDQNCKFRSRFDQVIDQNVNRLGSWIPFGENQVQTTDQAEYPTSSQFQFKQGIVGDNSSPMPNSWSPSLTFNYQHNPGHSHEFNDFSILGKPWEGSHN